MSVHSLTILVHSFQTSLPTKPDVLVTYAQLLDVLALQEAVPGKNASFSQWPVCTTDANKSCMACTGPQSSRSVLKAMGYSIRTIDWRLTVWLPFNNTLYTVRASICGHVRRHGSYS